MCVCVWFLISNTFVACLLFSPDRYCEESEDQLGSTVLWPRKTVGLHAAFSGAAGNDVLLRWQVWRERNSGLQVDYLHDDSCDTG